MLGGRSSDVANLDVLLLLACARALSIYSRLVPYRTLDFAERFGFFPV